MTKKELINLLEKYDDDNEIELYHNGAEIYFDLYSIEESVDDWRITLNLTPQ